MVAPPSVYMILKRIAAIAGYDLVITRKSKISKNQYEPIYPSATYAPWLLDAKFGKTWDDIKNYTIVDKYRCFELWQLVAETTNLSGALIEIGAWRGGSGAL